MNIHYADLHSVLYCGDALECLSQLPDRSVQCCVTSPPYWGLRDYGVSGQLGLEPTPEQYVEKMVRLFRDVRRVMCNDGTLWLNLGDSYNGSGKARGGGGAGPSSSKQRTNGGAYFKNGTPVTVASCKPKDLIGVPWKLAFALRDDGWYLRSDIVWHKPNPMPESVLDRPTRSHEFIFLMSQNEQYFYDADAVREPYSVESLSRYDSPMMGVSPQARQINGDVERREREKGLRKPNPLGRNRRDVWTIPSAVFDEAHFATFPPDLIRPCIRAGSRPGDTILDPFAGTFTTGLVAIEEGRKAIGIELNPAYCDLAKQRTNITPSLPLTHDRHNQIP